jgi:hypothetical protein
MKKIILFTILAGVLALFYTGCKKKSDPVPATSTSQYYFEADTNGVHTKFTFDNDAIRGNSSSPLDISGTNNINSNLIIMRIYLPYNSGVGTYTFNGFSIPYAYFMGTNSVDYSTNNNALGSGSVAITNVTATDITGTFNFKAYRNSSGTANIDGAASINVTNGKFKVPFYP